MSGDYPNHLGERASEDLIFCQSLTLNSLPERRKERDIVTLFLISTIYLLALAEYVYVILILDVSAIRT
jgi:hypothetical protein